MADEVLQQGVRGITDLMVMPGLINLDFADVRSVMSEMGKAMMGTGEAEGDNRAIEAAEKAISNPLLDGVSMKGAKGVIISITGGEDMRLMEVDEAASHIKELVDPDANIIWGSAFNNDLGGKIRVSVVATGIEAEVGAQPAARQGLQLPGAPAAPLPRRAGAEHGEERDADAEVDREAMTSGDELVLDADDILTSPVGSPPIAPPEDEDEAPAGDRRPTAAAPCSSACRTSPAARPRRRSTRTTVRLSPRADRHPALPQPAEQPVIARNDRTGTVPAGTAPFRILVELILHHSAPHRPLRTVRRNRSRQKGSGKILCATGRDDAGIFAGFRRFVATGRVRARARAVAAPAARAGQLLALRRDARRPRSRATSGRSPRIPRISSR